MPTHQVTLSKIAIKMFVLHLYYKFCTSLCCYSDVIKSVLTEYQSIYSSFVHLLFAVQALEASGGTGQAGQMQEKTQERLYDTMMLDAKLSMRFSRNV